ncbi:prophage Lp4 protein 12 [Levilactobacillus koreensis JCM 16448]|uniref:Prophage protein 12 n=1 Tax=Levilactobacillus koreensis TaxID=637971 RepID=A0AAC8UTN4_9LACO|nr:hypothetical protein [Levilactobacillus koreensis]AKP63731.1 prophage protein 12 [Levilactobacillus koreensis]KRK88728.1 prophage Lp4 protein 12 [Levilactobacillus koreensis JCM 16448]
MKIVYPSLVEDAYNIAAQEGTIIPGKENDVKAQIYRIMVQKGMLNEDGSPTQKAIDKGFVASFSQNEHGEYEPDTVAGLKRMYPMYEGYSDDHFIQTENGWAADSYVIRGVANQVLGDPDSTESQRQTAYAMLRQLEKYPK